MAANADALGRLHELVTAAFIQKVQTREVERTGKDGEPVVETVEPSAAELAAAVAFLKANNITASADEGSAVAELARLVESRRAKRTRPVLPDFDAQSPLQ